MELQKHNRLLLVFIHGFKGSEKTFQGFPECLKETLGNSSTAIDVDVVIYPRYETRGDLTVAATNLCNWLINIGEEQVARGLSPPLVVLVGHSMGGLLAADAYFNLRETSIGASEGNRQWLPRIIGILAFDTPYYGVESNLFAETARSRATDLQSKYSSSISLMSTLASAARTATTNTSTTNRAVGQDNKAGSKLKWGVLGAVVAATAAAGATAYWQREKLQNGMEYVTSHLEFVKSLTKQDQLRERYSCLEEMSNEMIFHCFYMRVRNNNTPRTFIVPPPKETAGFFTSIQSTASDEVDAHTTIFNPNVNAQYSRLCNASIQLITMMLWKNNQVFR
ncbi:hypothetical protein K493DRAFT_201154 [Basidiobolus meristosporus CBS 931.73]|uniref:DUF676 domain-containing protein n=1 Tax=Basidiobolus meristosporus CBS 931.73 TaxID=1314790 RepID=A0A1Y1ZDE8_9FUNG|nr:hypothetical protein K493DRAFT_201154 [Basidiobolus meristosporus CBS 931.73]|eukprot:ORY08271.1 hypothetical protein K493DRAFT_201154 [Basidiobolus meristosporus CBS 931.73]